MSTQTQRRERLESRSSSTGTFWATYLRLGFVILVIEAAAAGSYFAVGRSSQFLPIELGLTFGTMLLGMSIIPFTTSIAGRPWRARFSLGAALFSGIVVTTACALDGGIDSPLLLLMLLPVMNAGLALSARAVVACGAVQTAELVLLTATDPRITSSDAKLVVFYALILGATILAIVYASARTRLEKVEEADRRELTRLAETDSLTGCLNHRALFGRLNEEIDRARRYGSPVSLLVLDVDLFKDFNDVRGHEAGDEALAALGTLLLATARQSDIVGRVGGDEFAIILPSTTAPLAGATATRIVEEVRNSEIGIEVGIGAGELDPGDPTVKRIYVDADGALYRAKALGRGRSTVADAPHKPGSQVVSIRGTKLSQNDFDLLARQARRTQRDWLQSVARMDAILDAAPIGICFVDTEFRVEQVNSVFAEVYGVEGTDLVGKTIRELVPDLWSEIEPAFREVLRTGAPVAFEPTAMEALSAPDHTQYWLTSLFPVRVGERVTGIGSLGIDVTDRMALAESEHVFVERITTALAATVEERDPYTAGHQERVAGIAKAIASELGWANDDITQLVLASKVHDLGKIRIPAEILARPGRLNDAEMTLIRQHSRTGYEILKAAGFPESFSRIVLQHHERLDGSGYPQGLSRGDICAAAQILAVADVAEAMTAARPYRGSLPPQAAIQELQRGRGSLYDSDAVDAYTRLSAPSAVEESA